MPIQDFTRPAASITAVQWGGDNLAEVIDLAGDAQVGSASGFLTIQIRGLPNVVKPGWWVYRIGGHLGVCTEVIPHEDAWQPAT